MSFSSFVLDDGRVQVLYSSLNRTAGLSDLLLPGIGYLHHLLFFAFTIDYVHLEKHRIVA
jgi:hypothetical protein